MRASDYYYYCYLVTTTVRLMAIVAVTAAAAAAHTQKRRALKTMRIIAELELISNRMECPKKIDPFSDSKNFSFV